MTNSLWNSHAIGLSCLRCGSHYKAEDFFVGCPACLSIGYPASLRVEYNNGATWRIDKNTYGLMRYRERLPYIKFPTLGEGNTPLISFPRLAEELGVQSFSIKNEAQNPTGSHKDRCSVVVVARALEQGAHAVIAASSGNAGLSLAAYAAYAGLHCVIISQNKLDHRLQHLIENSGAELILTESDSERWHIMKSLVEEQGYYPATNYINPPVGSNLYGVQGYKTIAYELIEQQYSTVPDVILVPTSRADLLWGIAEGFEELLHVGLITRIPRLVAVEPLPRLSLVLEGTDYRQEFGIGTTPLLSIAGNTVTWQGLSALHSTNGCSIVVSYEDTLSAQRELLHQGLYLETSSATVLTAARALCSQGWIRAGEHVVAIGTAHGWKGL